MNRILIDTAYSTAESRVQNIYGTGAVIYNSITAVTPAMYSGTLNTYPNADCLRYLKPANITYVGAQGTYKTRRCVQHHTTSKNLTTLGLDSYIVPYTSLSFVFFNPLSGGGMPCHIVENTVNNKKETYWVDNGGNIVSEKATADSFRYAVFYTGVTYNYRTGISTYLTSIALYIEALDNDSGVRTLTRYDGPGDNRLLPYPYDPDNAAYDGIQWNGHVLGGIQPVSVTDMVYVTHSVTKAENVELT